MSESAQQAIDEGRDRLKGRSGHVAVRGMPRPRQDHHLHRAITFCPCGLDLRERAVLIVRALHNQDRHPDIAKRLGDIPVAEIRMEPWFEPRAEGAIDIDATRSGRPLSGAGYLEMTGYAGPVVGLD